MSHWAAFARSVAVPILAPVPNFVRSRPPMAGAMTSFEAGFSRLFTERFAPLFRYLAHLTGDGDVASDAAQDALLKLYQRGILPEDVGAWLVTVAHNHLRDQQRSLRRRLSLLVTGRAAVPGPLAATSADIAVEAAEQRDRVRAVLAGLTERERRILLLHHSGYSYREISVALDVALAGVGTILRRAGTAFRHAYEEAHGAPD